MTNLNLSFAMSILLLTTFACDGDISQSSDPSLSLSTDSISFSVPDEIGATSSALLELSNTGSATVIITEIELTENDETKEVSLIDAEDWTSETVNISDAARKVT